MNHTFKTGSHFEEWVTRAKIGQIDGRKNVSQRQVSLKHGLNFQKRVKLPRKVTLKKLIALAKMRHTLKNGSHLQKGLTIAKRGST